MRQWFSTTCLALVVVALAATASAQQTTGAINGLVEDSTGGALPGVTVDARQADTGFARSVVTDERGAFRLSALPVGTYDLVVELQGFKRIERRGVIVNVAQTIDVNFKLEVASVSETVQVLGESPLIETSNSAVGGVVETGRIEKLPLNGRQFANLAATVPGVGLGFHSDPTKSTQYAPQIGGGNGRNLNYQIDGGDNNDDTVGGLLQLFPLEAIDQFNVITSRYKAEYGRSNGGVLNIVTKSGTNDVRATWFTLFRDDTLNGITETERRNNSDKQDYRRWQYGGSFGGPILKDRLHYFAAVERTQQDTFQIVNTRGLYPELDGVFATPYRENLFTTKVTANLNPQHYVAVRYGYNKNDQPYGANPLSPTNNWGESVNKFNSFNINHNWVLGTNGLNEFIFQYADFRNHIGANSTDPYETYTPSGVTVGQNLSTPQTTEQAKWQFRDDFSWYKTGWGGIGHQFKAGVNFINEPHLFITFNSGKGVVQYTHLTNDRSGPISNVTLNDGDASANIPMKQYATYVQDDWRVTSKLTLNVGLRYDYISGYQFDQSRNPNFVKLQEAGRAGLLAGIKGLENFGKTPKEDRNNVQPRVGFAYDLRGDGRDIIRGGWGIYYDVGYTNSNALFAASDATGKGFGTVLNVDNQSGIRNPDGTFFRVGQPLTNITSQNQANTAALPLFGQFTDPRLEMPNTKQLAFGWSHQVMTNTVVTVDVVRNDGRDLNTRPRINTRPVGQLTAPRRLAFLNLQPNAIGTRPGTSAGKTQYKGLIFGFKRRMSKGLDLSASYTLASARSTTGRGVDELNQNNLQDAEQLYDDPRVFGPALLTDARHSGSIAGVIEVGRWVTLAPFFIFRSALPVSIIDGPDLNANGERNDLPVKAYAFEGLDKPAKEIGDCKTWNCGRGAKRTQFNLRASHAFRLAGTAHIEVIGEVFNVFNAKNPGGFNPTSALAFQERLQAGAPNPNFMQPSTFAGDFQQGEQRVGQIGFRFSF